MSLTKNTSIASWLFLFFLASIIDANAQQFSLTMDPNSEICPGESITISGTATGGSQPYNYLWSNGATTQSITVSPFVDTWYYLTVTDAENSSLTDSILISMRALTFGATNQYVTACLNTDAELMAFNGTDYLWSTGATTSNIFVSPSIDTWYYVTITDGDACPYLDSVFVEILPAPIAFAGEDISICANETTTLTASGGISYDWSNGDTGQQTTVSPSNTAYTVTVTGTNGCTDTDNVLVSAFSLPLPTVDIGEDIYLCENECSILNATGTNISSYSWSTGENAQSITICPTASSGSYWVTVTNSDGCEVFDRIDVFVIPNLTAEITPDLSICENECTSLTASGGDLYLWSTGETSPQITVCPTTNTTYSVTVSDAAGLACPDTLEVTVSISPQLIAEAGPIKGICFGGSTQIGGSPTASGGVPPYMYNWDNGAGTTANPTVSPLATTNYNITVTDAFGCTAIDNVTVFVGTEIVAQTDPDNEICAGDEITINASATGGTGNFSFLWSTSQTGSNITVSPNTSTMYYVTATDGNSCTDIDSIFIDVLPSPIADAGSDQSICAGNCANLMATGNGSYLWSTGETNANIIVCPTINTRYYVTVTSANGCQNVDSVLIETYPEVMVDLGDDQSICPGSNISIEANINGGSAPFSYLWNDGSTQSNLSISPTTTTSYSVTVTDGNGCTDSDDILISISDSMTVDLGPDIDLCVGENIELAPITISGQAPYQYNWSTGETGSSINVQAFTQNTYSVTITDSNGCVGEDQITVFVFDNPLLSIEGESIVCQGSSNTLSAQVIGGNSPYNFNWSDGSTTSQITVNPNANTFYALTVTDNKGCTDVADFTLEVIDTIEVDLGPIQSICLNDELTLTAATSSPADSYLWNTGQTSQSITVSPSNTSTYTVTVTSANLCDGIASKQVFVFPVVDVNAGPDQSISSGSSALLNASGSGGTLPYSYLWNTGQSTSSITVSPSVTTTYSLIITDLNGCTDTDEVTIFVDETPNLSATLPLEQSICEGSSLLLDPMATGGSSPYSYTWSTGENASIIEVNPVTPTTYSVSIQDAQGTSIVRSTLVNIHPQALLSLGPDQVISSGGNVTLNPNITGGTAPFSYLWSTNETTSTISVMPQTNSSYSLILTDANACISYDTILISIEDYSEFQANLEDSYSACGGNSVILEPMLSGGTSPYTYLWSTAETSSSISVNPSSSASYSVTVTDANNESSSATTIVNPFDLPFIFAGKDQTICQGETVNLSASSLNNGTISWVPGIPGSSILVAPSETSSYVAEIIDENGCIAYDTVYVFVTAPSIIDSSLIICVGSSIFFNNQTINQSGVYLDTLESTMACDTIIELSLSVFNEDLVSNISSVVDCKNEQVDLSISFEGDLTNLEYSINGGESWMMDLTNLPLTNLDICVRAIDSQCTFCFDESIDPTQYTEEITIDVVSSDPSSCSANDGIIEISVEDGVLVQNYSIDGGDTWIASSTFEDLSQGAYQISVLLLNGCVETLDELVILQAEGALVIEDVNFSGPEFCGQNNGYIEITVDNPDDALYSINGIDFFPGASFESLSPGMYTIVVLDQSTGCESYYPSIELLEGAAPFSIINVTQSPPSSCGATDGNIVIGITNPSASIEYSIDGGLTWQSSEIFQNLPGGTYTIVIRDVNFSCLVPYESDIVWTIGQNFTITVDQIVSPNCLGEANGSIHLLTGGNDVGLTFNWSAPSFGTTSIFNLSAGTYFVTITDPLGCSQINSYTVNDPPAYEPDIFGAADTTMCIGGSISFKQNNEDLNHRWRTSFGTQSFDSIFIATQPATYYIDVFDEDGCVGIDSIQVTHSNESLTADFLLPTQGVDLDIQKAVEISWPIPDSIKWHYDSSKIDLVDNDLNAYSFKFNQTGTFTIGLEIFKGNCSDYVEKDILIRNILDPNPIPTLNTGLITSWNLFPNPTQGNFALNVSLSSVTELQVRIYDDLGNLKESSIEGPDDDHTLLYNFTGFNSGTYYAVLIANNNSVVVPFVKI